MFTSREVSELAAGEASLFGSSLSLKPEEFPTVASSSGSASVACAAPSAYGGLELVVAKPAERAKASAAKRRMASCKKRRDGELRVRPRGRMHRLYRNVPGMSHM